jgi:hypothetical protein
VTDTIPDATTVREAVALLPSLAAVMKTDPVETPLTRPDPLTVAIAGLLEAQVTTRPDSGLPDPSRGVAVS